jgi:N-acetylglucosamine-6-phosphate deacetylase
VLDHGKLRTGHGHDGVPFCSAEWAIGILSTGLTLQIQATRRRSKPIEASTGFTWTPAGSRATRGHAVGEFVTAGLSPAEALATAISRAATACGVEATKGRLAPGQHADLLVVDGELETDITALHRPHAVLLQGMPIAM